MAYDGLFGPETVTWRLHQDPVLWIGGLRALLLQALHPAAMAGVLQHSDYRADPWGRLLRTAEYVGTVVYGSTAEAEAAGARVRGLHRTVRGVDTETGVTYRADDPHLLRWVHCCEVASFVDISRRSGAPLIAADYDTYVAEQTKAAALVGLDPDEVPASVSDLEAYFEEMRPALRADGRVREVARYIVLPPMPAWVQLLTPARPGWAAIGLLAFGSLPRWARRLYGAPALPVTDLVAAAELRALRQAARFAPMSLREGPHLRAARERAAAAEVTAAAS